MKPNNGNNTIPHDASKARKIQLKIYSVAKQLQNIDLALRLTRLNTILAKPDLPGSEN
jgi:hypothetical protein